MEHVERRSRGATYEAFGAYVRSQRQLAQLSLRQAAELARISNPYLSQIEHGLALPSITVISALAAALRVSADTLLMRAAGMSGACVADRSETTEDAIRHDARLDEGQKQALLAVLTAFVGSSPHVRPTPVGDGSTVTRAPSQRRPPTALPEDNEVRDHA